MPFLPPNEQRQSTEGSNYYNKGDKKYFRSPSSTVRAGAISGSLGRQQVTLVINPAVDCHYFLPGQRLTSHLLNVTALGPAPMYVHVNNLPKIAAWRRNYDQATSKWLVQHRTYYATTSQEIWHQCREVASARTAVYMCCYNILSTKDWSPTVVVVVVVGTRAKTQSRRRCYWLVMCLVAAVCSTLAKETGIVTFAVCLLTDSDVLRLLLLRRSSLLVCVRVCETVFTCERSVPSCSNLVQ